MSVFKTSFCFRVFLVYLLLLCLSACNSERTRPHIVLIVADDLGWGDVSFHGSRQIPTPNIDSLAHSGVVLHNYYVSPICSPSRAALLTGFHPIHSGMQHDVLNGAQPSALPLNFTLFPEYLRNIGYATFAVGKWHQGFYKREFLPTRRGFDYHFGYWTGHEDYYDRTSLEGTEWGIDFHENEVDIDVSPFIGQYSTELYTDKAVEIVRKHNSSKQPLFLYLAYQAVHGGNAYDTLQAPEKYVDRFRDAILDDRRKHFAAIVSALDDAIGRVVHELDKTGLLNETILVFTTDNGGATGGLGGWFIDNSCGSNWPLRGAKYTLWEGGVRGVGLIWSRLLERTGQFDGLMHVSDWLPTLYKAVGGDMKELPAIDGVDLWDAINNGSVTPPRTELLHNLDDVWNVSAIRVGDFKLVSGTVFSGVFDGWFQPPGLKENSTEALAPFWPEARIAEKTLERYIDKSNENVKSEFLVDCGHAEPVQCVPKKAPCLFNIAKDPCERVNLAKKMPKKVKQMTELLQKYRKTAVPPVNRPKSPKANPALHGYRWTVWDD